MYIHITYLSSNLTESDLMKLKNYLFALVKHAKNINLTMGQATRVVHRGERDIRVSTNWQYAICYRERFKNTYPNYKSDLV